MVHRDSILPTNPEILRVLREWEAEPFRSRDMTPERIVCSFLRNRLHRFLEEQPVTYCVSCRQELYRPSSHTFEWEVGTEFGAFLLHSAGAENAGDSWLVEEGVVIRINPDLPMRQARLFSRFDQRIVDVEPFEL